MNVVKEYFIAKTKIRIHDDFINNAEQKEIKELLVSLAIEQLKND